MENIETIGRTTFPAEDMCTIQPKWGGTPDPASRHSDEFKV